MIRRIAGSVNYSLSGVEEFEVIQVKAPSPTGDQDEEQDWTDVERAFVLQPSIGPLRLNRSNPKYA